MVESKQGSSLPGTRSNRCSGSLTSDGTSLRSGPSRGEYGRSTRREEKTSLSIGAREDHSPQTFFSTAKSRCLQRQCRRKVDESFSINTPRVAKACSREYAATCARHSSHIDTRAAERVGDQKELAIALKKIPRIASQEQCVIFLSKFD